MMPQSPQQPPNNMGEQAGRSFLSGFAGCLGVGLAVVVVFVALVAGCAVLAHSSHASAAVIHRDRCVSVILGQETATGHEADRPVTACTRGHHLPPAGVTCYVTPWGPYVAGDALTCAGRVYRHLTVSGG